MPSSEPGPGVESRDVVDWPTRAVETSSGPARVVARAGERGLLALGHGAGGGIESPDLLAVAAGAAAAGWGVVLVEQPWRVAGRKVASPPAHLDRCWSEVLAVVLREWGSARPLVLGGRSAGARVACRTASQLGAAAVACVSFPLHPPGRPERSRVGELAGVAVPALVVQGVRDPFGSPEEIRTALDAYPSASRDAEIVGVPGTHQVSAAAAEVAAAVTAWLRTAVGGSTLS